MATSLNPFAAKDTLTAVIAQYAGMLANEQISVTWSGAAGTPAGGSHTTLPIPVGTVGIKEIPMPNSVVAFNLNKVVTETSEVTRNGNPAKPSLPLVLAVQPIADGDPALSKPAITQATQNDTVIDLATFTGNATITVAPWPLIRAGQKVWLRCKGTKADNTPPARL